MSWAGDFITSAIGSRATRTLTDLWNTVQNADRRLIGKDKDMTQAEKINSIGSFEVKPKVDICKGCAKCDLNIDTVEIHTLQGIKGRETVAKCNYAECCQYVYEHLSRGES